jgi:hypothetical protein
MYDQEGADCSVQCTHLIRINSSGGGRLGACAIVGEMLVEIADVAELVQLRWTTLSFDRNNESELGRIGPSVHPM